ncbi:MAG: T9SS type A sorting domain-containing protein [Bacteroidota bacterium]
MKKIITLAFAFALLLGGNAFAQCTPNAGIAGPGIYPTPIDGIPNGNVGVAYSQVFTVNVPADTTIDLSAIVGFPVPPVTATINSQTITNINGLPPGLMYACDVMSCQWNGGTSGCFEVSGTPTTTGQYVFNLEGTLTITVPAQVPVIGGTQQNFPTPLAYNIEITNGTNVDPSTASGLVVEDIVPNPASDMNSVRFYSPVHTDFNIHIANLAGKQVYARELQDVVGDTYLEFDVQDFAPGIYFLTLTSEEDRVTRKMVIAR